MAKAIELTAGGKYNLRIPNGGGKLVTVHIDYILSSILYPDNTQHTLFICREYWTPKKRWMYYSIPYFILAIYNDWDN